MKADKVTVTITMESLSIDTLPAMVADAMKLIALEAENGHLAMADGDSIKWTTTRKPVEF